VHADLLALEEIAARPGLKDEFGREVYPGVHVKAAVLLDELLRRRPFDRANRAIALLCALVFLAMNDLEVKADDDDLVELTELTEQGKLSLLLVAAAFEAATRRVNYAVDPGRA
jgi:death on curing protein